ncbi:DFG10 [Candida theae]|uniref:Polyprenal reductase n=1 Tax=Candida theae TaxID=1198502 RepID=A0AAD5BBQ3_9ASCO|nr:DFG10 [Candida theae]KAI5952099.1 DFG10 [Candida theae]
MNIATTYNPQLLVSLTYFALTSGVLAVKYVPSLKRLLNYGKTAPDSNSNGSDTPSEVIDIIAKHAVVRKSWFTHFYICLFTLSTATYFKACHEAIIGHSNETSSATYKNLAIINKLLVIQGARRMVESFVVTKFSPVSYMNFAHYAVGMSHYVLIALATYLGLSGNCAGSAALTIVDYFLVAVFGVASVQQFLAHSHLAHLVKYSLPKFKVVASPHYSYEVIIYTVIAIFGAKNGLGLTSLMFASAWVFVVTNLSVSAVETYRYYQVKYKEDFSLKWAIFPGIL